MYLKVLLIGILTILMSGCGQKQIDYESKYYKDGKFFNPNINIERSFSKTISNFWHFFTDNTKDRIPKPNEIPIVKLTSQDILNMKNNHAIRLGHSNLLLKLDDKLIMTDPHFSLRASPFSFMGPKRFHQPPISVEELPFIDIVIISHNHYDHLDEYTLKTLNGKVGHIYTALGVGNKLIEFGFDSSKITELDWWGKTQNGSINIAATPAQHFSARGLFDRNKSFWSSWVIQSTQVNLFFSSDSGYSKDFKIIGEKFGPFDMTFVENGAYNLRWKEMHMFPNESVQAHLDLDGKIMFPIHNGTFPLSTHPWKEPLQLVTQYAKEKNVQIVHPKMGESIPILEFTQTEKWWE